MSLTLTKPVKTQLPSTLSGILAKKITGGSGRLKKLLLEIPGGHIEIRLPKELRVVAELELKVGEPVRIWLDPDSKQPRAVSLIPLRPYQILPHSCLTANPGAPRACVFVCNSKSCCRKGGDELYQKLVEASELDPGLQVRKCGCLKQCDSGPMVKIKGKGVEALAPRDVPHLVKKLREPKASSWN